MRNSEIALAAAVCLFAASSAAGQGRTVVSGTVTDTTGLAYNNGSLSASLTLPVGTAGAYLNGAQIAPNVGPVQLDATGSFLLNLPDNTLVQCATAAGAIVACAPQTQWVFFITYSPGVAPPLGNGPQTCSATLTISGSSQTVSSSLSSCPAITRLVSGTVSPTGGGPGGGGGGTPGPSGGSCLATSVLPGNFCAGPVPTFNGVNPSFEIGFGNSTGNAAVAGTTGLAVTGAPLVANSVAVEMATNNVGGSFLAPTQGGAWSTLSSGSSYGAFYHTVSSTASISPAITQASGSTQWVGTLFFLGGTITSVPHNIAFTNSTCVDGLTICATATVPGVSASNVLVIAVQCIAVGGVNPCTQATISDSVGNSYTSVFRGISLNGSSQPGLGLAVWIVQQPVAGSTTITVNGHSSCCAFITSQANAFELAGVTPYYTGSQGPAGFRAITIADLQAAGLTQIQQFNGTATIGADVTINTTATTIATQSITFPAQGCPCRVFISYSAELDYTTVTNVKFTDLWVSDGTNNMAGTQTAQSNGSSGALTSATYAGLSPVAYQNGQTKTFTWTGIQGPTTAGVIVRAACGLAGCAGGSSFQVSVVTSPN